MAEQFQPVVRPQGFRPNQVPTIDVSPAFTQVARSLDRNQRIENLNDQLRIDRAKRDGEQFQQLAQFSETALQFTQDRLAQAEEDKRIGAMYDALVGDISDQELVAESTALQAGNEAANAAATQANTIEQQTGNIAAGDFARRRSAQGLAGGFTGERAALLQARSSYQPFIYSYLASDKKLRGFDMSVRDAVSSGQSELIAAVIAQGREDFIRERGLQYATKTGFVSILGNTITNIDSAVSANTVNQAVTAKRKAKVQELKGLAYAASRAGQDNPEALFRQFSSQLFQDDTGLLRGEANREAIGALLAGYVGRADKDSIEALADIQQVPGQKGTELSTVYGPQIDAALTEVQTVLDKKDRATVKQLEQDMYRELRLAETDDQRRDVVEKYAMRAAAMGQEKLAFELSNDVAVLQIDRNNQRRYAELLEQLDAGVELDREELKNLRDKGLLTRAQYDDIEKRTVPQNYRKDSTVKDAVRDALSSATKDFLVAVRLKKDPGGGFQFDKSSLIKAGLAERILEQVNEELMEAATLVAATYGTSDPGLLRKELNRVLYSWIDQNMMQKGSKYDISDLINRPDPGDAYVAKNRQEIEKRLTRMADVEELNKKANAAAIRASISPVEWYGIYNLGEQPKAPIINGFRLNRGDVLFTENETKDLLDRVNKGADVSDLNDVAKSLGIPPLKLLNSQAKVYDLQPFRPQLSETSSLPKVTQVMSLGIPEKNAQYIAQNFTIDQIKENLSDRQFAGIAKNNYATKRQLESLGTNKGIVITAANDTGGGGVDFVISNGRRGERFYFPFPAEVLKVVSNANYEYRLEEGETRRGYGNNVELRFSLPNGERVDVLIAHFDDVNTRLRPGMRIGARTYIGTQGRTGSTTGAHVSADFFYEGSTSVYPKAKNYFLKYLNNYR